ncbi:hypothetical protein ACFLT8_02455 [Chloroflexota bacterium]
MNPQAGHEQAGRRLAVVFPATSSLIPQAMPPWEPVRNNCAACNLLGFLSAPALGNDAAWQNVTQKGSGNERR